MDLYLVLDVSGSMSQPLPHAKENTPKIELAKGIAKRILTEQKNIDTVYIYSFDEEADLTGKIESTAGNYPQNAFEQINNLGTKDKGGTQIWDSVHSVLSSIGDDSKSLLICVTDGMDLGSKLTFHDVEELLETKPNTVLKILDLKGELTSAQHNHKGIIKIIEKEEDVHEFHKQLIDTSVLHESSQADISVTILPVLDCSQDELEAVSAGLRIALPYLENLTQLKYYPLPTFLVDEYTIKNLVRRPCKDIDKHLLEQDSEDLKEITRFFEAVCITVHVGSFIPKRPIWGPNGGCYRHFSKWSNEGRQYLKYNCETTFGIPSVLEAKGKKEFKAWSYKFQKIPEVADVSTYTGKVKISLKEVLNILKEMQKVDRTLVLSDSYFVKKPSPGYPVTDFPKLGIWGNIFLNQILEKF